MMKKKRNHNSVLLGMLVCVVIALGVTVCGFWIMRKQLNETKNGQAQEKVYQKHYAFIVENPEDEFWENVYQAAKAQGEKQGIYVERISDYLSGDLSVKDYVEVAIAQQVDGILLQSSAKEVGEAMNEAMNQKIPVVTMLHDNYNGKRCSFLGINEVDIGKQYVSLIQKAVSKKKKNVCILTENTKGMGDHRLVIQTIRQQVKDADVKIVSVDADTEFGMEKTVRGLLLDKNKCPDVLVCLSMDATTYAYQTVVDQSKVGSVKIIGAYENDEIIMAIQKKILEASVTVSPKILGEKAVDTIVEYNDKGIVNEYQSISGKIIRSN